MDDKIFNELGWERQGQIKYGERNDGRMTYMTADITLKRKGDDSADWEEVENEVSLRFGNYGGHYQCMFDASEKGHVVIIDTDFDDRYYDQRNKF